MDLVIYTIYTFYIILEKNQFNKHSMPRYYVQGATLCIWNQLWQLSPKNSLDSPFWEESIILSCVSPPFSIMIATTELSLECNNFLICFWEPCITKSFYEKQCFVHFASLDPNPVLSEQIHNMLMKIIQE